MHGCLFGGGHDTSDKRVYACRWWPRTQLPQWAGTKPTRALTGLSERRSIPHRISTGLVATMTCTLLAGTITILPSLPCIGKGVAQQTIAADDHDLHPFR